MAVGIACAPCLPSARLGISGPAALPRRSDQQRGARSTVEVQIAARDVQREVATAPDRAAKIVVDDAGLVYRLGHPDVIALPDPLPRLERGRHRRILTIGRQ